MGMASLGDAASMTTTGAGPLHACVIGPKGQMVVRPEASPPNGGLIVRLEA